MPIGLIADEETYDEWFHAKVMEALNNEKDSIPHEEVMDEIQAIIDRKSTNMSRKRKTGKTS